MKTHIHNRKTLDNDDLIKILNIQPHDKSIDERLMEDFIVNVNKPPSFEIFEPKVLTWVSKKNKNNKKKSKRRSTRQRKTRKFILPM